MSVNSVLVLLTMMIGPGGNELLDYVPTQPYWKLKAATPTIESLIKELQNPDPADTSKPTSVRRLMAIRTLGEMHNPSALPLLQSLLQSKEPFVADYAKRALAAIAGDKPPPRAALPARELANEMGLLPVRVALIGQISERGDASADPNSLMANFPIESGQNRDAMADAFTKQLVAVADRVGNVRIDSATFGLSDEVGEESGYFVMVIRGQFDHAALTASLTESAAAARNVDGESVYLLGVSSAAYAPDGDHLIVMEGASLAKLPAREVIALVKAKETSHRTTPMLLKLLKTIDITSPMWAVVQVTPAYQQAAELTNIDRLGMIARKDQRGLALELRGVARNEKDAQADMDLFLDNVNHFEAKLHIAQMQRAPHLEPLVRLLGSIRGEAKGDVVSVSGAIHSPPAELYRLAMMFVPSVADVAMRTNTPTTARATK